MVGTLLNINPHGTYHQEVNRHAGVNPEWKKNGNTYTNSFKPDLTLDGNHLPELYVPLPDSLLYVILDIEHSGGCYDGCAIIQLSAKLADINGQELEIDSFNELINTHRPIEDWCGHNITKKDLEGKDTFDKVGQRFIDWIDRAACRFDTIVFVAYNGFTCDFRLLAREFERNHLVLPKHYRYLCMDPYKEIRKKEFFKDVPRRTEAGKPSMRLKDVTTFILEKRERYREVRERYEGENVLFEQLCGTAHDAMADVEALHIVLTDPTVWDNRKVITFDHFTRYADEFGEYERNFAAPRPIGEDHKPTKHGNKYEDEARDLYIHKEFTSKGVECKSIDIGFVKHPHYKDMGASPDGLLLFKDREPILLEIKCPYRVHESRGQLERSNMNKYSAQMQLQMHVMGVHRCHFVQFNPGTDELISDMVFIDPDFMKNPIFPQFIADVQARKTHPLEPLDSQKSKKRAPPKSKARKVRAKDVMVPPPKRKKSTKRNVIEESDDDDPFMEKAHVPTMTQGFPCA